jgi:Tol biopolymer transport system component/DNA-binding winged helix-turn-helix (wHTH) protein
MRAVLSQVGSQFKFGPFELSPTDHRLYRNGEIVLLPPKEFDLLLLLVQNAGQVMSRESLIKALWPDTVVEEANLNVHISALRKILAEGPDEQRYIETLPRLGYRFIAPVTEIDRELKSQTAPQAFTPVETVDNPQSPSMDEILKDSHPEAKSANRSRSQLWVLIPLWSLAIAIVGLVIFLVSRTDYFRTAKDTNIPLNVVPLTTYPGRESAPAFSPDGNQVAFVWSGEKEENQDIYVRLVEGGNVVRLTTNAGDDLNPTWSPDGKTIGFYRNAPEGDGVVLVPMLGGAERKLTDAWANRFGFGSHSWIHWSPQGKTIVLSDKTSAEEPFSLYLVSVDAGEKKRLTTPPRSVIGDCSPAFSPDGKTLAFVRVISAVVGEVYLVSTDGGEPRRLTFSGVGVSTLTWTADGREIIYSVRQGGKGRLFRAPVDGGAAQVVTVTGSDAQYPTAARQGNRLAWRMNTDNSDIYRIPLNGELEGAGPPSKLIASTADESSPRFSPDGKRIVFSSNRSGSDEIWLCGSDGESPLRLTSFRGPLSGSPNWSPDGKQIVFDSRPEGNADLYVIGSDGGQPRRLTTDPAEDIVPSWSHDGRWIYFTSNRSGRLQIWKMPSGGGDALQITKQGGFEPSESPDGQWIYYAHDRGSSAIWRVPTGGGEEVPIYDFHQTNHSRLWALKNDGFYFITVEASGRSFIKFFSFSNGSVKTLIDIRESQPSGVSGLALSPDGKWLLFPSVAQRGSDLMMIDNFR